MKHSINFKRCFSIRNFDFLKLYLLRSYVFDFIVLRQFRDYLENEMFNVNPKVSNVFGNILKFTMCVRELQCFLSSRGL